MREIGRQCPPAQLILNQCCWRCLPVRVMINLAVEQEQELSLPLSALYMISTSLLTPAEEQAVLLCVENVFMLQSRHIKYDRDTIGLIKKGKQVD